MSSRMPVPPGGGWVLPRRASGKRRLAPVALLLLAALMTALPLGPALPVTAAVADESLWALPNSAGRAPTAAPLPLQGSSATVDIALAPDGTAFAFAAHGVNRGGRETSRTWVAWLDRQGHPRSGWPVDVAGRAFLGPNGVVYVLAEGTDGQVLRRLGATGRWDAAWQIAFPGATTCGWASGIHDQIPLMGTSGTGYLVCGSARTTTLVYPFNTSRPGTVRPVTIASSFTVARVGAHDELFLVLGGGRYHRVATIASDGHLFVGAMVTARGGFVIAPDGTAYAWSLACEADAPDQCPTTFVAFDRRGIVPGWPKTFRYATSDPALATDGGLYAIEWWTGGRNRLVSIDRQGRTRSGWPVWLTIDPQQAWGGPGSTGQPSRPVVGPDGAIYVVGDTSIAAYEADGHQRSGWPVPASANSHGDLVGATEAGTPIVFAPSGRIYIDEASDILAVDRAGRPLTGWPYRLTSSCTDTTSILVAGNGTVYLARHTVDERITGVQSLSFVVALTPGAHLLFRSTLVTGPWTPAALPSGSDWCTPPDTL